MKTLFLTAFLTLCMTQPGRADSSDPTSLERKKMVQEQIRRRGVVDKQVLNAMMKVKRHLFVPQELRSSAYEDHPLSIGYDQTISQPFIVGSMTAALKLDPKDKVLEIGTGSGYQAAVLAEMVKEVYSIEIVKELAESARQRLKELGYKNIHVRHGDGFKGWPQQAPFDAIIVTAAPKEIPDALTAQLKTGGRMVIPVGSFSQDLYLITKTKEGLHKERLFPVRFVPMIKGKEGEPE